MQAIFWDGKLALAAQLGGLEKVYYFIILIIVKIILCNKVHQSHGQWLEASCLFPSVSRVGWRLSQPWLAIA